MPESIFKQVSLDILRLHQHTIRSLLATQGCGNCEIHDSVYVTMDGRYYVGLPCMPSENPSDTGILLIEDEVSQARLSWVARTREVKQKDNLYQRASNALQRRLERSRGRHSRTAPACLLELTPQQGRLTTGSKDLSLSPHDLMKALYPATHKLGEFAP
ncbi:pyridoxamine 5'-phosphate oxidase family protein [Neisseria yangbaofengii]|uniref:pyridoxamine 5'-phosphate oxidase family protein n=1 Tax=Neisseria yangbaofengii TaxID=2709396 RepID=UPI0013EB3EBC|nr:pyridoxamine 5'-phosphate oxidase family protein [Neisseria yangbaofengii]